MWKHGKSYDIVVAGGGLAGCAAAEAVASRGASVLLVERYGFLGGMAAAGLVNPWMPYWTDGDDRENTEINRGFFARLNRCLEAEGGLLDLPKTFNEEIVKFWLQETLLEAGVDLLLHAFVRDVRARNGRVESITAATKSGDATIAASRFVDATGDADLSALAGFETVKGREEDGLVQPMTLCFRVSGVEIPDGGPGKLRDAMTRAFRSAVERGETQNPRPNVLSFPHVQPGTVHFNTTRVQRLDPTDAADLTAAEIEGRRQAWQLYTILKRDLPEFRNAVFLQTAPQIGVRESRRIVAETVLTEEDILTARKFEDSIARGNYGIDLHSPGGRRDEKGTRLQRIPEGDYYTIPYSACVPKRSRNLLVCGRPISSTHVAHSAYRVMPICTCIGEGVGLAAAIGMEKDLPPADVDAGEIQALLAERGALC